MIFNNNKFFNVLLLQTGAHSPFTKRSELCVCVLACVFSACWVISIAATILRILTWTACESLTCIIAIFSHAYFTHGVRRFIVSSEKDKPSCFLSRSSIRSRFGPQVKVSGPYLSPCVYGLHFVSRSAVSENIIIIYRLLNLTVDRQHCHGNRLLALSEYTRLTRSRLQIAR